MTFFVVYVAVATAGVIANLWCTHDAWKDVQGVRILHYGNRRFWWKADHPSFQAEGERIIVLGSLRAELVRLTTQVFCLCLGVLAIQVMPYDDPDPLWTPGLFEAWPWILAVRRGLYFVTFTLVLNSLLNVYERRRIFGLGGVNDRNGMVRLPTDPAYRTCPVAKQNGQHRSASDDVGDRASGE